LEPVVSSWQAADEAVIHPPERPAFKSDAEIVASIKAGEELFRGGKAQCMKCHGPTALGDGSEERLYDDWNKDKKFGELHRQIDQANSRVERAHLEGILHSWLLPEQELHPRNL